VPQDLNKKESVVAPTSFFSQLLDRNGGVRKTSDNSLQIFPMTTLRRVPGQSLWSMTMVEPISATQTSVRCEVYSSKPNDRIVALEAMKEDFEQTIKKLEEAFSTLSTNTSIYTRTAMPETQHKILKQLEDHTKLERKSGTEIFPAADEMSKGTSCGVAEKRELPSLRTLLCFTDGVAVCKELDSIAESGLGCGKSTEELAW
jgi:hypothetical protein